MSQQALQVGIDFSHKKADFCVLAPNGQVIDRHQTFTNSYSGFRQAKEYLLHHLSQGTYEGIDVSAEATNNYWLPFFLQLSEDPQLQSHDIQLFLENPKRFIGSNAVWQRITKPIEMILITLRNALDSVIANTLGDPKKSGMSCGS